MLEIPEYLIEIEEQRLKKPKKIPEQYVINNDGTVTGINTGLMWKQNHETELFDYDDALDHINSLNENGGFANYCDWRLPTIEELESIIEYKEIHAINPIAFPNSVTGWFLSSTPIDSKGNEMQGIHFVMDFDWFDDDCHHIMMLESWDDSNDHYVRLVRG